MSRFRPVALRPVAFCLVALGLLLAAPASPRTFGRYNANLLPETPGAEGLSVPLAMLQLAALRVARFDGPGRELARPVPPEMVALPTGGLAQGSRANEGAAAEHPRHWVELDAFAIDRTEVPRAAYLACVEAKRCAPLEMPEGAPPPDDAEPVTGVRWQDAQDYCTWAGKRLPTEAQWEYAARSAGRDQTHPWGNELASCQRAWMTQAKAGCDQLRVAKPCAIQAGASAQGVCDLIGNVWEWTADWYAPYRPDAAWNPSGPEKGLARVARGGSWLEFKQSARAAARGPRMPETRAADLGFRCVLPLTTAAAAAPAPSTTAARIAGDSAAWPPESSPHVDAATGLRYIWLADGTFHFGCEPRDPHCFADEKPGSQEAVHGFWLAERDVTIATYERCIDAGICGASDAGGSCNARVPDHAEHPVNCVNWYQAELFCTWAGARLPSAIEWEYAAKGGEGRIHPWGDDAVSQERVNFCDKRCAELHPDWMWPDKTQDDGWEATSPVGLFPAGASRQGLLDMVGNAAQWTSTPSGLPARHVRGGGWDLYARYLRNSARTSLPPSHWFDNVTIRCAR